MQNSIEMFESELEILLGEYFSREDFTKLGLYTKNAHSSENEISDKISELYKKQLNIDAEDSNLRMQIDKAITLAEKKFDKERFFSFTLDLGSICMARGRINLAQEIFDKARRRSHNKRIKAKSLIGLADVNSRRANWTRGLACISEAESIYKELNDQSGLADCSNMMGSIMGELGNLEDAKKYFNNSLQFARAGEDNDLLAKIEANLGVVNGILGNSDESIEHLKKALILYKEEHNNKRVAEIYHNIGMNYSQTGNIDSAIDAFDNGIDYADRDQTFSILTLLYLAKADALIARNNFDEAKSFADKALELSHYLDDKLTIADIYKVQGIISRAKKDYQSAEAYFLMSLRINANLKNEGNFAESSYELGLLNKEVGNEDKSKFYLNQALDYYQKIPSNGKVKNIENLIGLNSN